MLPRKEFIRYMDNQTYCMFDDMIYVDSDFFEGGSLN